MKKIFCLFALLISVGARAQDEYKIIESWYLAGGCGTSIFLGDIAPHPKLTFHKDANDYKTGFVFRLGKRISPILNINFEISKGKISGHKAYDAAGKLMNLAFNGDFWSPSINARIDVFKFFATTRGLPYSLYVRLGGGPIYYRSVKTRLSSGEYLASMGMSNEGQDKERRAQSSVVTQGLGIYYDFSDNFRVEMETTLFNSFTDYLDVHHGEKSTSDDKIVFFNIDFQYTFDLDYWQPPKLKD
jgi:hypothetical protein